MGWGWPFSSSSTPAAPSETRAPPSPPGSTPQNGTALQNYQLDLMRLEKERLELMIKMKQEEAAAAAAASSRAPATRSSPIAQQALAVRPTELAAPQLPRELEAPWRRSAKQLGLFFAGATFLTASALISKRAVDRKIIASAPKLFQPSHHGPRAPPRAPAEKSDDQLVAVEALGLATLNVMSFGVMLTGGLMWGFDIANVDELRAKARGSLYGPNGVVDEAAEQQVEDWIVDVLSRREKSEGDESNPKKDA